MNINIKMKISYAYKRGLSFDLGVVSINGRTSLKCSL